MRESNLLDELLQIPHSAFPGVPPDNCVDRLGFQFDIHILQTRRFLRLRSEESLSNGLLLGCYISAKLDDLKTVKQGSRDGMQDIGFAKSAEAGICWDN